MSYNKIYINEKPCFYYVGRWATLIRFGGKKYVVYNIDMNVDFLPGYDSVYPIHIKNYVENNIIARPKGYR